MGPGYRSQTVLDEMGERYGDARCTRRVGKTNRILFEGHQLAGLGINIGIIVGLVCFDQSGFGCHL